MTSRTKAGCTFSRLRKVGEPAEIPTQHVGFKYGANGRCALSDPPRVSQQGNTGKKAAGTCHNLTLTQQEHLVSRGNSTHSTCMYSARMCPWYPHSVCSSCTPSSFSTHRKSCTCVTTLVRIRAHATATISSVNKANGCSRRSAGMSLRLFWFHPTRNAQGGVYWNA